MNFSASSLIAAFIFSTIGFWALKEGRRKLNFHIVIIGFTLIVYPYFVADTYATWGIGMALCGVAYFIW